MFRHFNCSNLVTGFLDTNPAVREATVKSIVVFAEVSGWECSASHQMHSLVRGHGSQKDFNFSAIEKIRDIQDAKCLERADEGFRRVLWRKK